MPQAVIADSDGEDDNFSPPRSPQLPGGAEPCLARSSDRVSHSTNSTDPAFFQNIYNEQNDAARQNVLDGLPDAPKRDKISSSEMTAPGPFQRTVTGLVNPSSLTSITDPAAAREGKSSSGKGMSDWTDVSTPGRKKAPVAKMDDPWDVPSSPENNQSRPVIKLRLRRSGEKAASEATSQPPNEPAKAVMSKSGAIDDEDSMGGRRKRRKIEHSQASQQGSNDVDLITIPFTDEKRHQEEASQLGITSSMLPPTLPTGNDASFLVATDPLTNSQKMEYRSVHLDSSGNQNHDMLPPLPNISTQLLQSSGSATNINTPRSDMPFVSTAPQPSEPTPSVQTRARPSSRLGRDSSPDIISTVEPPIQQKETPSRREQRADSSIHGPDDGVLVAQPEDQAYLNDLPIVIEDDDYSEPPIKARKTRGRPKKKSSEEAPPTAKAVTSVPEDGESGGRQKKKRGRPRKADLLAAAEKSPQVETISSEDISHVKTPVTKSNNESGTQNGGDTTNYELAEPSEQPKDEGLSAESQVEAVGVPTTGAGSGRRSKAKVSKENKENAVIPPALEKLETVSSEDSGSPARATEQTTLSGAKKSTDGKNKSVLGQASLSKPLYRVGLSKRSRIAPLLKSLRKQS